MPAAVLAAGLTLTACGGSSSDEPKGQDKLPFPAGSKSGAASSGDSSGDSSGGSSKGGLTSVTYSTDRPQTKAELEQTVDLMRRRAEALKIDGVRIEVAGNDIVATAPGKREEQLVALAQTAQLDFRPVESVTPQESGERCRPATAPASKPLGACGRDDHMEYGLGPVAVAGTDVADADAKFDSNITTWKVNLTFTSKGTKKFADVTARLAAQQPPANQFAIVLDGEVLSAPSVSQPLTQGEAEISGNFTQQSAEELAAFLRAGALPVVLKVDSVTSLPG